MISGTTQGVIAVALHPVCSCCFCNGYEVFFVCISNKGISADSTCTRRIVLQDFGVLYFKEDIVLRNIFFPILNLTQTTGRL